MTGPQYPPPPGPGSNAIGLAALGIAPIGDIPEFNYWSTVLSQYANSPTIIALIDDLFGALDQTGNLSQWYDFVFNIMTAQQWGLDVWGRILGVSRYISVLSDQFLGFEEASPTSDSFGQGTFYAGATDSQIYPLPDPIYLKLLLAKAAFNITDGSIPSINRILMSLFPGRGNAFVTDGSQPSRWFGFHEQSPSSETFGEGTFYNGEYYTSKMTMTYTFNFALTPVELAMVTQSGVLPRPTGVSASVVVNP